MTEKMLPFESSQDWFQGADSWAGPGEHPPVFAFRPNYYHQDTEEKYLLQKFAIWNSIPETPQNRVKIDSKKLSFGLSVCKPTHIHMHITHTQCNKKVFLSHKN